MLDLMFKCVAFFTMGIATVYFLYVIWQLKMNWVELKKQTHQLEEIVKWFQAELDLTKHYREQYLKDRK